MDSLHSGPYTSDTNYESDSSNNQVLIRRNRYGSQSFLDGSSESNYNTILQRMPSRSIGYGTGRNVEAFLRDHSANTYAENSTGYSETDDNDGDLEQLDKIDTKNLKATALSMKVKKMLRNKQRQRQLNPKKMSTFTLWKYNFGIKWRMGKENVKKAFSSINLWRTVLKKIEGNFGTGVLSYFLFLRALMYLAFPSFVLSFSLISLPQILDPPDNITNPPKFTGEELLTGENYFTNTIMYYGYYTNGSVEAIPNAEYEMPLFYIIATIAYFVFCLVILFSQTASAFRDAYITATEDSTNFVNRIFSSWDYGITSEATATLQHKTIFNELKEILSETERAGEKRNRKEIFSLLFLRSFIWLTYFGLCGGSMYLIYYVEYNVRQDIVNNLENVAIFKDIAVAFIVSSVNFVMPYIFNILTHFERYRSPRNELYVAVFRNFVLKIGLLSVVSSFYLLQGNAALNLECWETSFGQELYRLVILDFLFSIFFSTICAEFLRSLLSKCGLGKGPEFSIVINVLDAIYSQTLCWIGVYFCPLMPLIVIVKYFLVFYIKSLSVLNNCEPPKKRWRASRTRFLFSLLLLIAFVLSALVIFIVIFNSDFFNVEATPSLNCGPFRGLNSSFQVVLDDFEYLSGISGWSWLPSLLEIIVNPTIIYLIVVLLIVAIAFQRNSTLARRSFIKTLKGQILLDGKDKALLLKWLHELTEADGKRRFKNKNPHINPALDQRKRSNSNMSESVRSRSSTKYSAPPSVFGEGGGLTYVDPQHDMMVNQLNQPTSPGIRRKTHRDPLYYKALANSRSQVQRPSSMVMHSDGIEMDYLNQHDAPRDRSFTAAPAYRSDQSTVSSRNSTRLSVSSNTHFGNPAYQMAMNAKARNLSQTRSDFE